MLKIIHDRASTIDILSLHFSINFSNFFDCQIGYVEVMKSFGETDPEPLPKDEFFKSMIDTENMYATDVELLSKSNPRYWAVRPLDTIHIRYAGEDQIWLIQSWY